MNNVNLNCNQIKPMMQELKKLNRELKKEKLPKCNYAIAHKLVNCTTVFDNNTKTYCACNWQS